MTRVAIGIVCFFVLLAGTVALQMFLSRKQVWWYGLVLPTLTFLLSLLTVFSLVSYSASTSRVVVTNAAGEVVSEEQPGQETMRPGLGETLGRATPVFLVNNLPTLGLLVIYFVCREKYKRNQEIQKMRIQDLE